MRATGPSSWGRVDRRITNIEVDHVDFYPGGEPEIERAFARFAAGCELVAACADDPGRPRARGGGVEAVTFGLSTHARVAVRVGISARRRTRNLTVDGGHPAGAAGGRRHNLMDAAAATPSPSRRGRSGRRGARAGLVRRRPSPVRAPRSGTGRGVLRRLRAHPDRDGAHDRHGARRSPRRVVAIVQPHRYSRVQALWRELGASVVDADLVVVTDIYGRAARSRA